MTDVAGILKSSNLELSSKNNILYWPAGLETHFQNVFSDQMEIETTLHWWLTSSTRSRVTSGWVLPPVGSYWLVGSLWRKSSRNNILAFLLLCLWTLNMCQSFSCPGMGTNCLGGWEGWAPPTPLAPLCPPSLAFSFILTHKSNSLHPPTCSSHLGIKTWKHDPVQ